MSHHFYALQGNLPGTAKGLTDKAYYRTIAGLSLKLQVKVTGIVNRMDLDIINSPSAEKVQRKRSDMCDIAASRIRRFLSGEQSPVTVIGA